MSSKSRYTIHLTLKEQKDVKDYAHEYEMYQSDAVSDALGIMFRLRDMWEREVSVVGFEGDFESFVDLILGDK